jgi:glucokinase
VAIYQFLRDHGEATELPQVADAVRQWERYQAGALSEPPPDPAAAIGQAAQAGQDALSAQAMARFFEAYGAEAGNWALKLLPFGGLYIAGGIAAKNRSLLRQSRFLAAFKDKGRLSPVLEQVPVRVITNQQVGLLGSVLYGTAG